jgi:hypothetical protein
VRLIDERTGAVILTRLARRLRKKTGDERYRARAEDERPTMKSLIYVSCTRPLCTSPCRSNHTSHGVDNEHSNILDLLATEPVVASFSVSCSNSPYSGVRHALTALI